MKRMYKIMCRFGDDKVLYSDRLYESFESVHEDLEHALLICEHAWIEETYIKESEVM